MHIYLLILGLIALLSACSAGPDHVRPETVIAQHYKEASILDEHRHTVDWKLAAPGIIDETPWWHVFKESKLNQLMDELEINNQNIQVALARLRESRAAVSESRAAFFPIIDASGSINRGVSTQSSGTIQNKYFAGLDASWELDIWGGTRRNVEGAVAQAEAQAANLGDVMLSMRAELALNYFQLRTFDSMVHLYMETIAAYTEALRITENKYHAGTVTEADLAQAQALLHTAQAQSVDLEIQRGKTEHAIANLIGKVPAEFTLSPAPLTANLPTVEAGLPSLLLERRPDVAQAERQVAAANASIGVAQNAFFPALNFSASRGYDSNKYSQWFTAPYEVWSLGPALALNLFKGGAQVAAVKQAKANWEATVANYRQTVIQAFNDVEDALLSVHLLEKEEALQKKALEAAQKSERMLMNQYKAGTVSYVSVVTAQTTALTNARTVVQLRGARLTATVGLIKALGGGWDNHQLDADGKTLLDNQDADNQTSLFEP